MTTKRAFTLVELAVVVAIVLILSAILVPVFARTSCEGRGSSCRINQKQIALAFAQYAQDFDERLPSVASKSAGWADLLRPYAKSWQIWDCPSTPANARPTTDYFFNGRCAKMNKTQIVSPARTILLGEGDDARSTAMELRSLPYGALEDHKSPAWRHNEGGNYTFADGHVRWIRPPGLNAQMKWNPRQPSP